MPACSNRPFDSFGNAIIKAISEYPKHKNNDIKLLYLVKRGDNINCEVNPSYPAIKNNITINEDIVFASYANISFNRFTAHPPEISVDQATYKQGHVAVDVMLEILNNKNENN